MAVETNFASLLDNLKLEEPWLPPRCWESIPSQSGPIPFPHSNLVQHLPLFHTSTVSEASLVRLALNALQGVQSAIISIEKLSAALCSDPADRTFHRISSLWNRASSTHALGKILKAIGCSGYIVFVLRKFVEYFTNFDSNISSTGNRHGNSEPAENQHSHDCEIQEEECFSFSLVNQAFSVAVGKILEGYICALDMLYASVSLRRSSKRIDMQVHSNMPTGVGCLTSVAHSEVTLLEVYLHTRELRTQIEALGYICNLQDVAHCFQVFSFEDLIAKAILEFCNFPKGGNLLTYLYTQLQVADPAHCALLKFLFLRACEPYCAFIRSWIYKAEISDPYKEFVVEHVDNLPHYSLDKAGISVDFMLASIRERDCVSIPCFLKDLTIPLVRAGQQLQVVMKLLALCNYISTGDHTIEDFLPCWSGFSCNHLSYASPLTFNKVYIETMVLARNSYYKRMQEKVDLFLKKLEIRYQQVVPLGTVPILFDEPRGIAPSSAAEMRSSNLDIGSADSETSRTDEVANDVDSSECSSVNSFEEQIESEELIEHPNSSDALERKYLSALSFSLSTTNSSLKEPLQSEESCHIRKDSCEIRERTEALDCFVDSHHKSTNLSKISLPLESQEPNWLYKFDIPSASNLPDSGWPVGTLLKNPFCIDGNNKEDARLNSDVSFQWERNQFTGYLENGISDFSKMIATDGVLEKAYKENQLESETSASSHLSIFLQWKLKHCSNYFSMNPVLTKNPIFHVMSKPGGRRSSADHGESFPCFDFSSVEDRSKCGEKLVVGQRYGFGSDLPSFMDSSDSAINFRNKNHDKQDFDRTDAAINDNKMHNAFSSSYLQNHEQEGNIVTDVSGGSGWESLLGSFGNPINNRVGDQWQSLSALFDIPLDFIIDKCLLQEIMLQYKYVSKLTIKLLEEGFDLHEHFRALRRYHFMEVADWADLFIMSLWHHKRFVMEADHRVSEIQGFLELSIQRSSCEKDCNKDRLFVFMKGHDTMPLSTSMIGVHSFDFLGLGYKVDWPVSIVLTPSAMKIYAEIFSFLIQVKLAAFSLTGVWCSLKELKHLISQKYHPKQHTEEVCHFNLLMKMRHQVNHFVSTLQQYVQSQLSHVSWSRFLHALKHKVKDMMDIESVHMAYLKDSLHICFLSDESQFVASIIGSVLQCALDFQSCLTGGMWDVGLHQGDLLGKLSNIDISRVLTIKQRFEKNLRELHLLYLKSPKHAEFGLSRFWGNLNYNNYYSDAGNQIGHYGFAV